MIIKLALTLILYVVFQAMLKASRPFSKVSVSFLLVLQFSLCSRFNSTAIGRTNSGVVISILHSQKRHRLDASCGFYRPDTSCTKPVDFIKLHQICEHQTSCNLIFADLLQVDETTCIKSTCSSQLAASLLTTCNRLVIIKP